MKRVILNLIFQLMCAYGLEPFAHASNHLITQRMAYRFNTRIDAKDFPKFTTPLRLKYYLIPKAWVQIRMDAAVSQDWTLLQNPGNPEFVRIPVHPLDDNTPVQIEFALRQYGFPHDAFETDELFLMTESRSLYPVQAGRIPMSPRLSMTNGFGEWSGREGTVDQYGNTHSGDMTKLISPLQADFAIEASRKVQQTGVRGQYFEVLPDRMTFTVQSPDGKLSFGGTFRDIRGGARPDVIAIPGFVSQHLEGAQLLALANDKLSVRDYFYDVEAPVRGRAWAEFYALTGFVHSSPHSQNQLPYADKYFRLIGALGIRDLADLIPDYEAQKRDPEMARLKTHYEPAREALSRGLDGTDEFFYFRHNFNKGNNSFVLSSEELKVAERRVAEAFIEQLSRMSKVPVQDIKNISHIQRESSEQISDNLYMVTTFHRHTETWKRIQEGLAKYRADFLAHRLPAPKYDFHGRPAVLHRHPQLAEQLRASIARSLKGLEPSDAEHQFARAIWEKNFHKDLSAEELEFAMSALVMTRILPDDLRAQAVKYPMTPIARRQLLESVLKSRDVKSILKIMRFIELNKLGRTGDYSGFLHQVYNQAADAEYEVETCMKLFEGMYFAKMAAVEPSERLLQENQLTELSSFYRFANRHHAIPSNVRAHLRTLLIGSYAQYMAESFLREKEFPLPARPGICEREATP